MKDQIRVLITQEELQARIQELGKQIGRDYEGKTLHLVCVLKGGAFFLTALSQAIPDTVDITVDFMSVTSYGNETESSGIVRIIKDLDEPLKGKHVLVVEDIIDSGRTLAYLLDIFKDRQPASVKLCTLLDKPSRRVVDVDVDYVGFEIEDLFVLGFGLDYAQLYRNLPYIGVKVD